MSSSESSMPNPDPRTSSSEDSNNERNEIDNSLIQLKKIISTSELSPETQEYCKARIKTLIDELSTYEDDDSDFRRKPQDQIASKENLLSVFESLRRFFLENITKLSEEDLVEALDELISKELDEFSQLEFKGRSAILEKGKEACKSHLNTYSLLLEEETKQTFLNKIDNLGEGQQENPEELIEQMKAEIDSAAELARRRSTDLAVNEHVAPSGLLHKHIKEQEPSSSLFTEDELTRHAGNWSNLEWGEKRQYLDQVIQHIKSDSEEFDRIIKEITVKAYQLDKDFIRGPSATFAKDVYRAILDEFDDKEITQFESVHPLHEAPPPIETLTLSSHSQRMFELIKGVAEDDFPDQVENLPQQIGISIIQPRLLKKYELPDIPKDARTYATSGKVPRSYNAFETDLAGLFNDYSAKTGAKFFHGNRHHQTAAQNLAIALQGKSEQETFEILRNKLLEVSSEQNSTTYNPVGSFVRRLKYAVYTQGKILESKIDTQQSISATVNAQALSRDSDKLNLFLKNNSTPSNANSPTAF